MIGPSFGNIASM